MSTILVDFRTLAAFGHALFRGRTKVLADALKFLDKAKGDGKPFFLWLNPTRMHVVTHLSDLEALRTPENGWSIQEAGMAQLDDIVGSVMTYLKDNGLEQDTIVVFTTDNGAENFTWPDGGQRPSPAARVRRWKAGSACPRTSAGPARSENGIFSGLDWFPTLLAAAGPQHHRRATQG